MSQPTRLKLSLGQFSPDRPVDFRVVIAYEDFFAGTRAKETFDRLGRQLGAGDFIKCDMWKFEVLGIPKLNKMAAHDAVEARMVVIAAHEGTGLPDPVKRWIGDWLLERDSRPKALVALLDSDPRPDGSDTPILSYLRTVVEVGQMEFFCQQTKWSEPEAGSGTEPLARAESAGPAFAEISSRIPSYRGWGIND